MSVLLHLLGNRRLHTNIHHATARQSVRPFIGRLMPQDTASLSGCGPVPPCGMSGFLIGLLLCLIVSPSSAEVKPAVNAISKTYIKKINLQKSAFSIDVAGAVDMDNAMTLTHENCVVAYQNNISLTIENVGDSIVRNPRIVTNDKRHWRNMEELCKEIKGNADDDQELIYSLYEHCRANSYHAYFRYLDAEERYDPVRIYNVYGFRLCGDSGGAAIKLFNAAGQKDSFQKSADRALNGHQMWEAFVNGKYQFIDVDQNAFYLDRDNEVPVGGDELVADHDLAKRELAYGPVYWPKGAIAAAALFGNDDFRLPSDKILGYPVISMNYDLRPGEKIIFRWDNIGKCPRGANLPASIGTPPFYGNSKLIFEPCFTRNSSLLSAASSKDLRLASSALESTTDDAEIIYKTYTPYTICGSALKADFLSENVNARFIIAISEDKNDWKTIFDQTGRGDISTGNIQLDELLLQGKIKAVTNLFARIQMKNAAGCKLTGFKLETDIMAAPLALPRLNAGSNNVAYADDTQDAKEVIIKYEWKEFPDLRHPLPPQSPVSPPNGSVMRASLISFSWPNVPGCDTYHIQLSRFKDFPYTYRPNYDMHVRTNCYEVPFTGMFNNGETYYWKIRSKATSGVWSHWSPVWRFTWQGPMVPREVKLSQEGPEWFLTWKSNEKGTMPVKYEVYGSDEKGFSINKQEHELAVWPKTPGKHKVSGNYIGSTEATSFKVISSAPDKENMNKAFYRVVAVDAAGVESGPSAYAELPRPYIWNRLPQKAIVNTPYSAVLKPVASIGDLQYKNGNSIDYFQKEAYRYRLVSESKWLRVDPDAGILAGTPQKEDVGAHEIELEVSIYFPDEVTENTPENKRFIEATNSLRRSKCFKYVIDVVAD